jgi:hypothetical protein
MAAMKNPKVAAPKAAAPKVTAPAGKKEENAGPEDYSKPGTLPFAKLWGPEVKYSDQLANGDDDDDKEIEDEDDPRDMIADDDGFVNQWKIDKEKLKEWGLFVQLDSDINVGGGKFSEEIADGLAEDDKDLVDINDKEDDEVDENMLQLDSTLLQIEENDGVHGKGYSNPGPAWKQIMAQVDAKHSVDASLF